MTAFSRPGYRKAEQAPPPKQFKGLRFIMLLTRVLGRYKNHWLSLRADDPRGTAWLSPPVQWAVLLFLPKKSQLHYNKWDAAHHCAQWPSISRAEIWVTFMQTPHVTAPLPWLLLWNLRKILHYKCRANESSWGRIYLLKKNNGVKHEMQNRTCFLHILGQKCHADTSNATTLLIKQG